MNSNSWHRSFDADGWTEELRRELGEADGNGRVGQRLVSETERVRVWSILLKPGERLGFHKHVLDYFWTAVNPGRSRQHTFDGTTRDVAYRAGETRHFHFGPGEYLLHDIENIGDTDLVFTTVEHLDSDNTPLPVDNGGRP